MNKKARIDTYETTYDIDFVVANKESKLSELRKLFEEVDGSELDPDFEKWNACSAIVTRKKDKAKVVLIKINNLGDGYTSSGDELLDTIDICSHEAVHTAIDIYNMSGSEIDVKNQEVFAYFVAYITERIAKTLLNK